MQIFIEKEATTADRDFEGSARQLLSDLGVNSEEVLIAQNDTLVTLDAQLHNSDVINILSVISGG